MECASFSKAASLGIPTDVISSRADWKSGDCFAKFYLKPIEGEGHDKPHSTRSASFSKAASLGTPTDVILSRAGWKSGNCFAKYYLKPIEGEGHDEFQSAVLQLD